jgi:signal transduction histidine kinase
MYQNIAPQPEAWVAMDNYIQQSNIHEKSGNYKKANEYLHKYITYLENENTSSLNKRISDLQKKYESGKQAEEIRSLKKDNRIQMLELQKQKNNSQFLLIVAVMVFVVLSVTAIYFVLSRKSTRLLKEKNNQLEEANKKLKESEMNLKELIATKDKFFSIIAHDIRSPLSSFLSLAEVLAKNMNLLDENEKKELVGEMSKSAANINDLLENLLQWARSQTGTIRYNPNTIDVRELIDNTIYLLKAYAEKKKVRIVPEINGNALAFADSNMIFTVLMAQFRQT